MKEHLVPGRWTLNIDCDHPGSLWQYRAHLWTPEGRFAGDTYVSTKWGARRWARRQIRKKESDRYGGRTTIAL